jgi:uncharacterized SAM-binding protein YcdF (DUF218 family)
MRRNVFFLFSLPLVGVTAVAWRVDRAARREPSTQSAKAIVVLGARVLPSGHAAPALQYRAEKAAELYRAGRAPLILFSGGSSPGLPSEASIARDLAVAAGVPPGACVLEDQSHTTAQNAELTAPLLKQRGIDEVLLVSDGYHLLRAQAQFARLGITTQPVPSGRRLGTTDWLTQTLRESLALWRRPWLLFASLSNRSGERA